MCVTDKVLIDCNSRTKFFVKKCRLYMKIWSKKIKRILKVNKLCILFFRNHAMAYASKYGLIVKAI